MIDTVIYWIGCGVALSVLIGALALSAAWAIEKVLSLLKLTKVIVAWHIDKARREAGVCLDDRHHLRNCRRPCRN